MWKCHLVLCLWLVSVQASNIDSFLGCSATQKDGILTAYKDALRLADRVLPYSYHDELLVSNYVDTLSVRFFGRKATAFTDKARFVNNAYSNIASWWPLPVFDWIAGKRIHMRCTDVEHHCTDISGRQVGAYATNDYANGPSITFCDPFWQFKTLDDKKKDLDKKENEDKRHNTAYMITTGQIFLHEMTHLDVISGSRHIIDYIFPDSNGIRAYKSKLCEKLARNADSAGTWDAVLNADSYAMFATSMWFAKYYGIPDSAYAKASSLDDYVPQASDMGNVIGYPVDGSSDTPPKAYPTGAYGYDISLQGQASSLASWASTALTNYQSLQTATAGP